MPARVSIFVTCVVDQLFPKVGLAMARVLERAGFAVDFREDQTCCGQPAFNSGFREQAVPVAEHFIRTFRDAEYVVVPSGSCTSMITHHFFDLFPSGSAMHEETEYLAPRVFEFSRFLLDVAKVDDVGAQFDQVVTYHDSCHALRELHIKDGPRRLLSKVKGLELREMSVPEECCGFGGTFSVKFADVSRAMAKTKVDSIAATGASAVVSIDSSCLMQLQSALTQAKSGIRTMHLAEVLDSPMTGGDQKRGIEDAVANPKLQLSLYSATARLKEKREEVVANESLPEYQDLRTQANLVKKRALDNLDHYLEEFEKNVIARGGKVIWARDGAEVSHFLINLAKEKGVRLLVKSKSMTTEEIHLNKHLEAEQLEPVETDLGEFIIQLADDRPFHIVAPAVHLTRHDVADIFERTLHVEREETPEKQAMIARVRLREKFLAGGIGISGANFLVADSGAIVLVENEGNARLCTTAPKIHVAVAFGIEKIIPRAQDLAVFLKLLGRSGTGQLLTVYTSFLSGPRRPGEIDGPEEFYVVLMDNGRTRLLADEEKRESLYCIRCGACLNACPVYRKIGGHNYPGTYSGPIGAIITPQFNGIAKDPWLPFASSLCGACAEVCPVKIDIPKILLALRRDLKQGKSNGLEGLAFRAYSWMMQHPRLYALAGRMGALVTRLTGATRLGRSVPLPARQSFRDQWRNRK